MGKTADTDVARLGAATQTKYVALTLLGYKFGRGPIGWSVVAPDGAAWIAHETLPQVIVRAHRHHTTQEWE